MKLNTFDLYRCYSKEWSDLSWRNALLLRIKKAREAKDYYRIKASKIKDRQSSEYAKLVRRYNASNRAAIFNEDMLQET